MRKTRLAEMVTSTRPPRSVRMESPSTISSPTFFGAFYPFPKTSRQVGWAAITSNAFCRRDLPGSF